MESRWAITRWWGLPTTASSAAIAGLMLCSCHGLRRLPECQRLQEQTSSGLSRIQEVVPDAGSENPASYRRAAARYEQLASTLLAAAWKDAKLSKLVSEYAESLERASQRQTKFAETLEAGSTAARETERKLKRHARFSRDEGSSFRAVVSKIDSLCHAPR